MTEQAKRMGIPEEDLRQAMILVRNMRIQAIRKGLDPRAMRIALIFANLSDLHFARKKLDALTLLAIENIGNKLYEETAKGRRES